MLAPCCAITPVNWCRIPGPGSASTRTPIFSLIPKAYRRGRSHHSPKGTDRTEPFVFRSKGTERCVPVRDFHPPTHGPIVCLEMRDGFLRVCLITFTRRGTNRQSI